MGVYIKGMEMPDGCYGCPVITWCRTYKNNEWKMPKKLDDCPMVEVPEPHGRLIDADKIGVWWTNDARIAIEHAPTVIEAEGE